MKIYLLCCFVFGTIYLSKSNPTNTKENDDEERVKDILERLLELKSNAARDNSYHRHNEEGLKESIANERNTKKPSDSEREIENPQKVDPNSPLEFLMEGMVIEENGKEHEVQGLRPEDNAKTIGDSHDTHKHISRVSKSNYGYSGKTRNFVTYTDWFWDKGIIPYRIYNMSTKAVDVINQAIQQFNDYTCIRWVPDSTMASYNLNHKNVIYFINEKGCWSYVGNIYKAPGHNNIQGISLEEPGCISVATAVHEMLHAMGSQHEQSRKDRDKYVDIAFENVDLGINNENMAKEDTEINNPYDAESAMQYGLYSFSVNGEKTILFKDQRLEFLADSADGLEFYDIQDINDAYHCSDHCINPPTCQNGGYVNFKCVCVCPDKLTGAECTQTVSNSVADSYSCGGVIELGTQIKYIQSPNFGSSNYPTGLDCTWLIRGVPDNIVRATVQFMDISAGSACYHFLEFRYNLLGQDGPKRCGTNYEDEVWDSTVDEISNAMIIGFNSDLYKTHPGNSGFKIKLESIGKGCISNPCFYGKCYSPVGTSSYTCTCNPGVTGVNCDILSDSASVGCTFEYGERCFLTQDKTDKFDWVSASKSPADNTGPSKAHGGYQFMYTQALYPRLPGQKAVLVNSVVQLASAPRCLSFWYHMYGSTMGTLNVYTEGVNVPKSRVFTAFGDKGDQWFKHEVDIPAMTNLKVYFEGIIGSDSDSNMALDDIFLTSGTCSNPTSQVPTTQVQTATSTTIAPTTMAPTPAPTTMPPTPAPTSQASIEASTTQAPTPSPDGKETFTCDFEDGESCIFIDSQNDDFDWTQRTGTTPSSGTGPDGANSGSCYLYTEVSSPVLNYDKAVLTTEMTKLQSSPWCLTFAYHMKGYPGTLGVAACEKGQVDGFIWDVTGSQGDIWNTVSINIPQFSNPEIQIHGIKGDSWEGDIAIDSLVLKKGVCEQDFFTCDFEDGESCIFTDSHNDDFDWTLRTGTTPSSGTGPDGANSGAYYMYTEVSSPVLNYDRAVLTTEMTKLQSSPWCLIFAYHMKGYPGTLGVAAGEKGQLNGFIWSVTGSQGNSWNTVSINIPQFSNPEIQIHGIKGDSWQGDIAIDSLVLSKGVCVKQSYACDFEDGENCIFTDSYFDDFDWTRRTGTTPSAGTGPDGAVSGLYYIYIEVSSPVQNYQKAVLTTENTVLHSSPWCLTFSYHMKGYPGTLGVAVGEKGEANGASEIWSKTGSQGDSWNTASVDIPKLSNPEIQIRGSRGSSFQGDIAIDNLILQEGSCATNSR